MSVARSREAAHSSVRPSSPYVGLVPFGEDDAAFFFGRSGDAEIVAANLRSARLTILYGPSGVGKSSLLMAGAVHRLREAPRDAVSPYAVCVLPSWRDDPTRGLQEAAMQALQAHVDDELPAEHSTLAETLRAWTERRATLLVVLDQFEEYFMYHPGEGDADELSGFAAELEGIVNDPSLGVHVLLSIREDAWARLDHFEGHIPALFANYLRVEHLDVEAAREAIEGPIAAWNETIPHDDPMYDIEPELVDAVIAAAAGGELALTAGADAAPRSAVGDRVEAPFLQLVMERLWRETVKDDARVLTLARLEQLGGARRIVENHLLEALGKLTPAEQAVAADALRFLVTRSKTKIAHSVADLAEWTKRPEPEVAAVLDKLSRGESGRILRAVVPAAGERQGESYELFHDLLAEPVLDWRRRYEHERDRNAALKRYIRIGAVLFALVAVFATLAVLAYRERGHARAQARQAHARELEATALGGLSTDPQLSIAEALDAATLEPGARAEAVLRDALIASRLRDVLQADGPVNTVAYSGDGRLVLVAGGSAASLFDANSHRRLRVLRTGAPITTAAFVGGDRVLAGSSDGKTFLWDTSSGQSSGWLTGPGPVESVSEARTGMLLATWKHGQAAAASAGGDTIRRLPQPGQVAGGVLDPTGRFAATIVTDRAGHVQARLYDIHSGSLVRKLPPLGVADVEFSPDGSVLAVASRDGTTTLWHAATGRSAAPPLDDGGGGVYAVAFNPAGTLLATGGADGGVRVWRLSDGERLYSFEGHTGHVVALAWTRDGRILADASSDRTSRIWDVTGVGALAGRFVGSLLGAREPVTSVAFSRDGRTIVTGSADGHARIWDAHVAEELEVLGHQPEVTGVAFSPNGALVVSGGADGTSAVWDIARRKQPLRLRLDAPVVAADFAGDRTVVTAAGNEARLWHPQAERVVARARSAIPIGVAQLSGDRNRLLLAGGRTLEAWDVGSDSLRLRRRIALGSRATSAALSRDGTRIAATTANGVVRLWTTDGDLLWSRNVPGSKAVALSPNGDTVAVIGAHAKAYVLSGDGEVRRIIPAPTPSRPLTSITFSPDGRTLLTTRNNGDARLWDVQPGHPVRQLHALVGQFGNIQAAAFSDDGRWIATAGPVTVVLWSAETGELLFYLRGPTEQLTSVAFAPGARDVVASSKDGTVRLYRCAVCGGLEELEAQGRGRLARARE